MYIPDGWINRHIPQAHVEKAQDCWDYERKEHNFVSWEDTTDILKIRYGKLRPNQKNMLKIVRNQNDRQIDVFYDPVGNHGKTWLTIHLYEHGQALIVPRASCTPEKMSSFICSAYTGEPYIIIDIPRSRRISNDLYEALEEIKDGIVHDHRYSGRTRNIRGARLIVFTNNKLDTKSLSFDRWRLHGV